VYTLLSRQKNRKTTTMIKIFSACQAVLQLYVGGGIGVDMVTPSSKFLQFPQAHATAVIHI